MTSMIDRAFAENLHPRGSGAQGGQFVAGGKAAPARKPFSKRPGGDRAGKSAGGGNLSFDGKRGSGYGKAGGDKRVKALQAALNKLGLTDGAGKALKLDGKLGPKTTAAIKKAQRALGLKPDGVVTPALLRRLTAAKSLKRTPAPGKPASAPQRKREAAAAPAKKGAPARTKAPAKKTAAAPRRTSRTVDVSK